MQERIEMYPLVKAYPIVDASTRSEAVCVAGVTVTTPRRWVRLFPLDFRGLETEQQFRKYQRISVETRPSIHDDRPESPTPILSSIRRGDVLDSDGATWRRRRALLEPLLAPSLCAIRRKQRIDRTSLGAFRPAEIFDLEVESVPEKRLGEKRDLIEQQSFFDERTKKLQPLPYKFRYRFRCAETSCRGHRTGFIDWEVGALTLKLLRRGADTAEVRSTVRDRFLTTVCGPERDPIFLTGNIAAHQTSFLILGVMWPRRYAAAQTELFPAS